MNEYILFGLYGAGIMILISGIKTLIKGKPDLMFFPNATFGLVSGALAKGLYDIMMREIYPVYPVLTIISLSLLGLGILGTAISLSLRRIE